MDVNLVPLEEQHIEQLRQWRNMPEVSAHMFNDDYITEEGQAKWYEGLKTDQRQLYWLIEFREKLIGLVYLHDIDYQFKKCTWGFYVADTRFRGEGIGTKALYKLLIKVFDELELNKIQSEVIANNEVSIKTHESLGFRREGYFREYVIKNNTYLDVISLGLLKKDWDLIKEALHHKIYQAS